MSLEMKDVTLSREGRNILYKVTTEIQSGIVTGVVGPNGSGKTSFLRVLYGYLAQSSGEVLIDGVRVENWEPRQLSQRLGICPQVAEPSLDFKVEQLLALRFSGNVERVKEALAELTFLRLHELLERNLSQLSGGERQRVRLGSALLHHPPWLVLDEPANHLDLATSWSLFDHLSQSTTGGVLVALHDLRVAALHCHQLLVFHRGVKVAQGPPREVLSRALLREVFGLDAEFDFAPQMPSLNISGVTVS